MRYLPLLLPIALAACSLPGAERVVDADAARIPPPAHMAATTSVPSSKPNASRTPFQGAWRDCGDASALDECSRYTLVQRGSRVCGTWSYVATGDGYDGRVVADAISATDARRIRVCGRPGSEASTECDAGWEVIDRPLRVCDGRLSDSDAGKGACHGRYARADDASGELAALAKQPWVQACLAGAPLETSP